MMAAITAAEQGANIQILERLPRVGKKLLATGNGHCNLSNLNSEMNHYHGNPDFIQLIFSQFDRNDTLELFENMGLSWIAESDFGRVFPRSMQASSVLDILRNAMAQRGITENCDATVQRIERTKHDFLIKLGGGDTLQADRVILAAGGRASPNMGSNGSGFTLAEQLGHSIRTPSPAIVQLIWDEPFSKSLKGLKIQASISLKSDGNELRSEIGEIHFMEDGLSGIPALQMARLVNESLEKEQIPVLHINLLPDLQSDDIHKQLMDRMDHFKNQPVQESLISLVHKRLIPVLLKEARIPCDTICSQLNESPVKSLMDALICWKIPVTGTRSWSSAQVTAGGIVTDEVYPSTLESKLVPGLYFAGEIMDVDGDCGGYNLQWAWSSGWVAGKSAADIS
ncbi:NAD(P)/FAD-dependent oxidoreductase [candidate division KSB1 bacterium]|nr:NAD(P)/FAD-dependent oxidoreductase [candidate division KSB1 bacterium]